MQNLRARKLELQEDLFELICSLYENYNYRKIDHYKLDLALLEEYNNEYKELTGLYYLKAEKVIEFYEKLWEI